MKRKIAAILVSSSLIAAILFPSYTQAQEYIKVKAIQGDNVRMLLKRYLLHSYACNVEQFRIINDMPTGETLKRGNTYILPIQEYTYNSKSIRTTIGDNDYEKAVRIQKYNENLHAIEIKKNDYRVDKILWVPHHEVDCNKKVKPKPALVATSNKERIFPIFGPQYEKVPLESTQLRGKIYYIVSGHGGPDPGAVLKQGNKRLCEDEYAYDISLRLARNLIANGATVYVIIRDPDDGIRSGSYLIPDKEEVAWGNKRIPSGQKDRLNQRHEIINKLYASYKAKGVAYKDQTTIMIHIDSRSINKRIDVFFYHFPGSKSGHKIAKNLQKTLQAQYERYQKGRGYGGTVKSRDLHMLRETKTQSVYIELGNIKNPVDLKRFTVENNRQLLANWLCLGIIKSK